MQTLADSGYADIACAIATQPTYPGWGDWLRRLHDAVGKLGRVRFPEPPRFLRYQRLFLPRPGRHPPHPDGPGFRHVILRPQPAGSLTWVNAWHEGPYGRIVSNWRIEYGTFIYNCVVPPGSRATLELPSAEAVKPHIAGAGRTAAGKPVIQLESGKYLFTCKL